jgi:hypothetical protein
VRPALVDRLVVVLGGVGADRGHVDQVGHAGRGGGVDDPPGATHAELLEVREVV